MKPPVFQFGVTCVVVLLLASSLLADPARESRALHAGVVKVDITPEVTFKGGKATAAQIHWGTIDAPMLAYSVIWPGATLDNSVNVLQGQLVKMINEFMGKKCGEVKDQLPMRASYSPIPQ